MNITTCGGTANLISSCSIKLRRTSNGDFVRDPCRILAKAIFDTGINSPFSHSLSVLIGHLHISRNAVSCIIPKLISSSCYCVFISPVQGPIGFPIIPEICRIIDIQIEMIMNGPGNCCLGEITHVALIPINKICCNPLVWRSRLLPFSITGKGFPELNAINGVAPIHGDYAYGSASRVYKVMSHGDRGHVIPVHQPRARIRMGSNRSCEERCRCYYNRTEQSQYLAQPFHFFPFS